jgi:hypothetical protein
MTKAATLFLIFFATCIIVYGQQEEHKVITTDSLQFPGELRSRKIPVAIGSFFELPANCAKDPTTFIRATRFAFPDASLGKIDTCTMVYELESDTVRKMIIALPIEKSIKQAGQQASKQFGKATYHKEGQYYVYVWNFTPRGKNPLLVRMEVAADQKHGMLYVEEQM